MRHIDGIAGLQALAGEHIGTSHWVLVDQPAIDAFADLCFDHNWVHTDPVRAASSPFGGTIAHGGHSLAIIGGLLQSIFLVGRTGLILAYGFDKVRFPAPVPVGSRVRLAVNLAEVRSAAGGGALDAVWGCTVEIEGSDRPACVADMVMRYFAAEA